MKKDKDGTEYIDVTPTWTGILPWLLHVIEEGEEEGRQIAKDEILRLGRVADAFIAQGITEVPVKGLNPSDDIPPPKRKKKGAKA